MSDNKVTQNNFNFTVVPFNMDKVNRHTVIAWGNTINGELGLGDQIDIKEEHLTMPTPVPFSFSSQVRYVACGESHTLFVLENGTLWSCGSNDFGQLGHDKQHTRVPELVEGLNGRTIVRACAGYAQSFAIDNWGTLLAWGSWDSHGQLGLGLGENQDKLVNRPRVVKSLATKNIVQVATGHFHSIMLTNAGEVYTCGSNSHGQLGLGYASGPNQTKPVLVEFLIGFPASLITAGGFHCFILSKSASVYGWGKNNMGQLGHGDTIDKCQPTQLATLRSLGVRYITAGSDNSAFLTQDGGVFTCGSSMYGQLGHSSLSNEVLPRKILEFGSVVTQIACGGCHTLCLANNKLYSFGLGSSGQLGEPNVTGNRNSPMPITALKTGVYAVYAGGDQSFVISNGEERNSPTVESAVKLVQGEQESMDGHVTSCDYRILDESTQILTITLELVQQMCSAVEPVDQEIMTLAEVVFASPSCWNSSFLIPNNTVPCTYKNIGIDLQFAAEVLSKLEGIKASGLLELVDSVTYSNLLPKLPHQLKLVEILRVYVLLPLTPSFYNGRNYPLQIFFAQRILTLNPQLNNVIIRWLYNSPTDHITRFISIYKRLIVFMIDHYSQSSIQAANISRNEGLRTCLSILELLHIQNKTSMRLSYHTFNIPQLSTKVDLRQEYSNFLSNKDRSRLVCFCDFPFVFDAQAKTLLLQIDQALQMRTAMNTARNQLVTQNPFSIFLGNNGTPQQIDIQYLTLIVSRNNIVNDTIQQLYHLNTQDLKKPLRVKFTGEEAEDAGGVRKEFFLLIIREILDPKYGMFRNYEESRLVWFNGDTFEEDTYFFIIGLLCGLAIYNFTIINLPFPLALYKKILDEKVDLNDLKELTPSVARSLEQILEYDGPDFEDVFCLNFEITQETFGEVKVIPLKAGGSSIPVTQENKAEFVDLYVDCVLNKSVQKQFGAFKLGFQRVCVSTILDLFQALELQAMIVGNEDYDWGELERYCSYKGVYHAKHPTIIMFWEVFHALSLEEKKQFLLFLTGSDRIPLLGMKALKMIIQPTSDERYLPVAHTCFNLLDLPQYQTKERLKYKVQQVLLLGQSVGFGLA